MCSTEVNPAPTALLKSLTFASLCKSIKATFASSPSGINPKNTAGGLVTLSNSPLAKPEAFIFLGSLGITNAAIFLSQIGLRFK